MAIVSKYSLNGNTNDSAGTNNGTATNVSWVNGKMNGAGSFNGSNSTIISPTGLNININSFTVNLWIKTNSIPTGTTERRAISFLNSSSQNIFYFQLYQSKYYAIAGVGGVNGVLNPLSPIPTVGTWEMITSTETGNIFKMYRNGVEISTGGSGTFSGTIDRLQISSYNFFDGIIDEVEIHNTAITPAQVKNKYLYYNGFM